MKTMRNILAIALIVLISGISSFAENDSDKKKNASEAPGIVINGVVKDFISGESLVGAEVQIVGTNEKSYTDFDGNFEFKNLKPGKYDLIISYISYHNSLVEDFEVTGSVEDREIEVKLQSAN